MALPVVPLNRGSIVIGGTAVEYRSLSRAEALEMANLRDKPDEAEIHVLCCGTGCTREEAQAFRSQNDVDTAGLLIDAIINISGLSNDPKA